MRRILVEAAWCYRFRPAISPRLRSQNKGVSTNVSAIAWKAQHRLHERYRRLVGRGKNKQQTITAVARELSAFIWDIARQPQLLAA